jgi:hypothetical protein
MLRPRAVALALLAGLLLVAVTMPAAATAQLPGLPPDWPAQLQLGLANPPGEAATLRRSTGIALRAHYLSGGANTGRGWATWNRRGRFISHYMRESIRAGMTPVFTLYQLRQSRPGRTLRDEPRAVLRNLANPATMRAWYEDLALALRRAGAFHNAPVVLHLEPDLWGYVQQRAVGDDAASVPAAVASSGLPELAGLPDTAAGFAQAIVRLRDRRARNVRLAYHLSDWGTGTDVHVQRVHGRRLDALAGRAAAFQRSLGAAFDLLFTDWTDADAGFKDKVRGDGGASWWQPQDFMRHTRFLGGVVRGTGLRAAAWQLPLGNTVMRAVDDSWGHFRDNRVQWLLDGPAAARHRRLLARNGVIALLFGSGAEGATCACDWRRDGVTNPKSVFGNLRRSYSADDDGGFFRHLARLHERRPTALPR